jgi:hypothetical protein
MKQTSLATLRANCPAAIPPALRDGDEQRAIDICLACLRAISANGRKRRAALQHNPVFVDRVPPHALTNNLELDETPIELLFLNYIEDLLIKRVRPLQVSY